MSPIEKYRRRAAETESLLCVGLDSDFERLPEEFKSAEYPQFEFNKHIIGLTHQYVCAYKPNAAFYEARGAQGWQELAMTMDYVRQSHQDIFTILDAKRGDIGSTNKQYAKAIFDDLGFDAVTIHPYAGRESLQPFLDRADKVSIILCRTSNPGSGELQSLEVSGRPLWRIIAEKVRDEWNANGNCMLVAGATYPQEMRQLRELMGDMAFLVPGVGAQEGSVAQAVQAGLNSKRGGLIVNASRGVIFADDPAAAARQLREEINQARNL